IRGLIMQKSHFWSFFAAAVFSAACAATAATSDAGTQTRDRLEGTLLVVWGDPQGGSEGGGIRFSLALPDGSTISLQIRPDQRSSAIRNFGKSVVVQGRKITDAHGRSVIAVSRVLPGIHGSLPEV